jgi:hypothetical protein
MAKRNLVMALSLLAALALPAAPALAAGHGHGHANGRQTECGVKGPRGGARGHGVRQIEGTVVSYGNMVLVVQPMASRGLTVTVSITSSTVITAAPGVSTTLAAGEQVHVAATADAGCTYTAVRVVIQSATSGARHSDIDQDHAGGTGPRHKGGRGHGAGAGEGQGTRQFEGSVVSLAATPAVSGTTFVLQLAGEQGTTVTVMISSSTIITAEQGVTTTTLAAGEQVHAQATVNPDGTYSAVMVVIQGSAPQNADEDAQTHGHKKKD